MQTMQAFLAAVGLVLTLAATVYTLRLHRLMRNGPATCAVSSLDMWLGFVESLYNS